MRYLQRTLTIIFALPLLLCPEVCSAQSAEQAAANWHQWRGPDATGVSRTATPPVSWSETNNVKWKTPIDGTGRGGPIVWNDRVFLVSAIKTDRVDSDLVPPEKQPKSNFFDIKKPNAIHQFVVLCLDRKTGKEIWRQIANELIPHDGVHQDNDYASASPTTDGKRLYCWFGSAGLFCYDLDGALLWKRDLGKAFIGSSLGEGCSPVIHDDKLVIVRDQARQSFIETLDATTGKTLWKVDRDEDNAWATPRIIQHSGKTQVITTGSNFVRSNDLETGKLIWKCSGLTGNCIPCPVIKGDYVYCMSGYKGYSLMAIPLNETGDISGSKNILWTKDSGTPYIPSPVLYDDLLYYTQSNQAILTVANADDGEIVVPRKRLSIGNIYSSPVAANGHVYLTGRGGKTLVLEKAREFKVLSENQIDERVDASPAVAGNALFLRGQKSLYCIAND